MSLQRQAAVVYLPSLRTLVHRLRATTNTPSSLAFTLPPNTDDDKAVLDRANEHTFSKPSLTTEVESMEMVALGLNSSLPLPGAVGGAPNNPSQPIVNYKVDSKVTQVVECRIQPCPEVLHDSFMQLFPGMSVEHGELHVISLSERTTHDMTSWSPEVEEERESLLGNFVDSAKEICSRITGAGYWADFIDPSSGRAFYSEYSHNVLFETDDRFGYLGFEVMDLGCCKCISHPLWGTHTFIGTIFTNTPYTSPVIQRIINI